MTRCCAVAWWLPLALCMTLLAPTSAGAQETGISNFNAVQSPCFAATFEDSHFTVCSVDTHIQDIALEWTDRRNAPLRSFQRLKSELGPNARRVRFAMNAGMFDVRGTPIGLFVENGRRRVALNEGQGAGNFYLQPNGVFWEDEGGAVGVEPTETYALRQKTPRLATQSGPMLVFDGKLNSQIAVDGPSKFIRNGVGIRGPHEAMFVVSEDPVSFGRLARFFRDELHCPNALYFDGAISSLWAPQLHRMDDAYPLGPMLVVLDR